MLLFVIKLREREVKRREKGFEKEERRERSLKVKREREEKPS